MSKKSNSIYQRTKSFLDKANAVHNDKYDYSMVEYVNTCTKVTIICHVHGNFSKTPANHLLSQGCPKCQAKINTTQAFVIGSTKKHGGKYDYSNSVYVNSYTKLCIICPTHGKFWQKPHEHLSGRGCSGCHFDSVRSNNTKFMTNAHKKHNNLYDYSKVVYLNAMSKVCIICPEHGEFLQSPNSHLSNHGCSKCSRKSYNATNIEVRRLKFLGKAETKHGKKYDYSLVKYVNSDTAVEIICPEHGIFQQSPYNHLMSKCGCSKCANNKRSTTSEFIRKARNIHSKVYDYSKVDYETAKTKVVIICREHGEFSQIPNNHLSGLGCPSCSKSGINLTIPGIRYYIRIDYMGLVFYKIGITNNTVLKRFGRSDYESVITVLKLWNYPMIQDGYNDEQKILKEHGKFVYDGDFKPLKNVGISEIFVVDVLGLDFNNHS